ncbi:MAG: cysteine desulfurase [Treponema sp.]|nr:cysteine desulfurase [Treponema sp.]
MAINNNKEKRIYFDWAASSPYALETGVYMYANPSSLHYEGKMAKQALEDARNRCAAVLKVPPETLYFTSGGTEANSIALFSNLMRKGQGRILSSMAEHASIREGMETLEKMGKPVSQIAVDSAGRVTGETLTKALEKYPETRFISVMSVNNETGAITDIAAIRDILRKKEELGIKAPVHFHCDLVQAAGKIPVDIDGWEIDTASLSAHKICGPRGIGLLYSRRPLEVFYKGGGQEKGVRGGTENTMGAAAFAKCLEQWVMDSEQTPTTQCPLSSAQERCTRLMTGLAKFERCVFIPKERSPASFSPYILQAAFKDIPGEVMARALDDLGFAVSTGSACSSSSPERPVLAAMGIEEKLRIEGIRISQGYTTTDEEIDLLIDAVAEVLKFL